MREIDVSWKRAITVISLIKNCNFEITNQLDKVIEEKAKMKNYIDELSDIIEIRKDAAIQATDIDCTVDDIECNTDELEGHLDNAFSQIENLKDNLRRLKKGE